MKRMVYVLGYPGCGKTTAVDMVVSSWTGHQEHAKPFLHHSYDQGVMLGGFREGFGGTDMLSMSVGPKAGEWFGQTGHQLVIGEGDRLSTRPFFNACGVHLDLVLIAILPSMARERAQSRADSLDLPMQPMSWWKGRVTKVDRLAQEFPHHRIDGTLPPAAVADALARYAGTPTPS